MKSRFLALSLSALLLPVAVAEAAMIGIRGGDGSTSLMEAIESTVPQPLLAASCDPNIMGQICHVYFNDLGLGVTELLFQLFDSAGNLVTTNQNISLDANSEFTGLSFSAETFVFTLSGGLIPAIGPIGGPLPRFTLYVVPNPMLPGEPFRGLDVTGATTIPEPASLGLVGAGLGALLLKRRNRRSASEA